MNDVEGRATAAVAASAASIVLLALVASVPASPFLPELPPGVAPTGPLAWLAGAIGLDALRGGALVALGVLAAVAGACAFGLLLLEAWRGRVRLRTVVLLAVAAHAVVLLVPVVFSRDVYSYIAYGRIAGLYGANPYVQTPIEFPADPILSLVGHRWVDTPGGVRPACSPACRRC